MQIFYLKTLLALKEIPDSFLPFTINMLKYVNAEEKNIFFKSSVREELMQTLNIGPARVRQLSIGLRKAGLLKGTPDRSFFEVSDPLLIAADDIRNYSLEKKEALYVLTVKTSGQTYTFQFPEPKKEDD